MIKIHDHELQCDAEALHMGALLSLVVGGFSPLHIPISDLTLDFNREALRPHVSL